MRVALAVVVLVAACADDHGILVLVNSQDPDVTQIRLFVGTGSPTTSSLAIPAATGAPTDRSVIANAMYFDRDPHDTNDVVSIAGPRTVRFAYPTDQAIPIVIAVGYDSNDEPLTAGVLHDLAAPTGRNQFAAYEVDLDTHETVFGPAGGPDGALRLGLWSRASSAANMSTAECAGIQTMDDDVAYFVVRPDDQDCDGWTNDQEEECRPDIYNGSVAADPRHPSCLVPSPPSVTPYCAIGGEPCVDGTGPTAGTCTATHVCMPSSVCTTCGTDYTCAAAMTETQVKKGPFFDCLIEADQNGRLCGGMTVTLERPPTGGYNCSAFEIGDGALGDTLDHGDMKVKVSTASTGCLVTLDLNAGETGGVTEFSGLTQFTLANHAGVALPIHFTVTAGDCGDVTQPAICYLGNDDPDVLLPEDVGMTQCAAGWTYVGPPMITALLPAASIQGGATLTRNGNEMIFIAGNALYRAQKSGQAWITMSTPTSFGLGRVYAPKLSADGLHLLVKAETVMGSALYEISRTALLSDFDPATLVTIIDMAPNRVIESATFGSADNSSLIIAASTAVAPITQLYTVPLAGNVIGAGIALEITAMTFNDRQPSLSYDGLHLYFESDRNGNGEAIYVVSRPTPASDFSHPVRLAEISTGLATTVFPFVTDDSSTIYYNTPLGLVSATRGAF